MALFFDADWFDARLGERGPVARALAAAAGLSAADLALVFKDQRELSAGEVAVFAELLGVDRRRGRRRAPASRPRSPADAGAERGSRRWSGGWRRWRPRSRG